jgi:hypothetical protein
MTRPASTSRDARSAVLKAAIVFETTGGRRQAQPSAQKDLHVLRAL